MSWLITPFDYAEEEKKTMNTDLRINCANFRRKNGATEKAPKIRKEMRVICKIESCHKRQKGISARDQHLLQCRFQPSSIRRPALNSEHFQRPFNIIHSSGTASSMDPKSRLVLSRKRLSHELGNLTFLMLRSLFPRVVRVSGSQTLNG